MAHNAHGDVIRKMDPKDVATCYNLACACALSGDAGRCRHALTHAVQVAATCSADAGSGSGWAAVDDAAELLLRVQDLLQDEDLATVRDAGWFQELVRSM